MRIALAQIIQESNSFAPTKTTRDHFASQYIRKGNEASQSTLLERGSDGAN